MTLEAFTIRALRFGGLQAVNVDFRHDPFGDDGLDEIIIDRIWLDDGQTIRIDADELESLTDSIIALGAWRPLT